MKTLILLIFLLAGCTSQPVKKEKELVPGIKSADPVHTCNVLIHLASSYSRDLYFMGCVDKVMHKCNSKKDMEPVEAIACYDSAGPTCMTKSDEFLANLEHHFQRLRCSRYFQQ